MGWSYVHWRMMLSGRADADLSRPTAYAAFAVCTQECTLNDAITHILSNYKYMYNMYMYMYMTLYLFDQVMDT